MLDKIITKIIATAYAQDLISCPDGTMADPSIGCVQTPGSIVSPESSILQIILKSISAFMTFVVGVAVITLIYGGIRYALSAGDESQIQKAKRILFWGIFGLVVALLATFVTNFILNIVT